MDMKETATKQYPRDNSVFHDRELFMAEQDRLFSQGWICVGTDERLPTADCGERGVSDVWNDGMAAEMSNRGEGSKELLSASGLVLRDEWPNSLEGWQVRGKINRRR